MTTLSKKSNPFTVLNLGSWIDLDTCNPKCQNAPTFAAIASRNLTNDRSSSQKGFSTFSKQLESPLLQTSLRPQLAGSAKSHSTEKKLGSSERKQESERSELGSLLAGTNRNQNQNQHLSRSRYLSRNRHLTSPWVKSKVHTGDPVMGKLTPGGHSSRTAGVNTEVDTELDVVVNNIKKTNHLLRKSEVRGGEANLHGGSLKGGTQHTQISMTPQQPTYIFPFAGHHPAIERRWVPSAMGPFWSPSVMMSVTLSLTFMVLLTILWSCCQNTYQNKINDAKKRLRRATTRFTGRASSAVPPASMTEAVTGGVPKTVLDDATRAMDKVLARTKIMEEQQADLRRLVETIVTRQSGGTFLPGLPGQITSGQLSGSDNEYGGPILDPVPPGTSLILRNQSENQLQNLINHQYRNHWLNSQEQKSFRSSNLSSNPTPDPKETQGQVPPTPDPASNKVHFLLPTDTLTASQLEQRRSTALTNGSPSMRNRRTTMTTETAGDPKPTGISDGSDNRMYPHLLPTDDFISQLEHRILEAVANSIQMQQDAEDENDKKKYAMQK